MTLEELEQLAESGFSGGKWQIYSGDSVICRTEDDNFGGIVIQAYGWCSLSNCNATNTHEAKANAKLAAAAPSLVHGYLAAKKREIELVEALRELLTPVSYTHLTLPTILLV